MWQWIAANPSPVAAAVALGVLWLAESLAPFFLHKRGRTGHAAQNVGLGLVNAGVRASFFPAALLVVTAWSAAHGWGLLRVVPLPAWGAAIVAVLLLDLVNYAVHVVSHRWKWLWRFHCVHHHDDAVDSTTALRFHAGDVLFNSVVILGAVAVLGISVEQLLLYEAILLPLSVFHHGNIRISERVDRVLRAVIVTPRMHWVHHSRWHEETDSNYSGIFSFWDRMFGTFRLRGDPGTLEVGLDGYEERDHATLRGCLMTPVGRVKSEPGVGPEGEEEKVQSTKGKVQRQELASVATDPSRGRHMPLALAVASSTPLGSRTLRACETPEIEVQSRVQTAPSPG